tara:strand:- start:4568 stop:4777 length:210 start_codon:yes stop_codon:yes gene_type:complete
LNALSFTHILDYETLKVFMGKKIEITMGIKPGPKRIADSTGKPDRRQRDNKDTPGNKPSLKPHKHKKGD